MHTNTSETKSKIREVKLQFLQNHYKHSLGQNIPNNKLKFDTNITDNMTYDTTEYSMFEVAIANQFLMNKIESNSIYTHEGYRNNPSLQI